MFLLALLIGMSASLQMRQLRTTQDTPTVESRSAGSYSLDQILDAIRFVETGGEKDGGRYATGDHGLAIGPYQIHLAHWLDTRLGGEYEDCRDPLYARHEVITYWRRWCPEALERCDAETLARVHNGGPKGNTKSSTLVYWEKARKRLEQIGAGS